MSYCTVQDIRDEGVPDTGPGAKTDAEIQAVIDRVCVQIDKYTGRFFEPRDLTVVLDGTGRHGLLIGMPIIDITSVSIGTDFSIAEPINLDDIRIYNRHLTENLTNPDDRESPKIEFVEFDRVYHAYSIRDGYYSHQYFHYHYWPVGTQNIEIVGTFGYTDYDAVESDGITPILIERASVLMTLRDLDTAYGEADKREDRLNRWRVTEYKTRDQTIKYDSPSKYGISGYGSYTGDPEIDKILIQYTRPPMFGAM
jgi:hypothetical protein